jgi:hypothetical protein
MSHLDLRKPLFCESAEFFLAERIDTLGRRLWTGCSGNDHLIAEGAWSDLVDSFCPENIASLTSGPVLEYEDGIWLAIYVLGFDPRRGRDAHGRG